MVAAHASAVHTETHTVSGEYVKALVFGGLDGILTTFAIVAGVAGANLSSSIVLMLGVSNLVADGISMGVGEMVSGYAEIDFLRSERQREEWEVEHAVEHEKREMIDLYTAKGMAVEDAVTVVDIISKDPKIFVDIMMVEELDLNPEDENGSPAKQGIVMFSAFVLFGSIPLIAYVVSHAVSGVQGSGEGVNANFIVSCSLTIVTLFILGACKQYLAVGGSIQSVTKGGILMVTTGTVSASAAFGIGALLGTFIHSSSH